MGKSIASLTGHFAILRTYHAALRSRSAWNGLTNMTLADELNSNGPCAAQKWFSETWNRLLRMKNQIIRMKRKKILFFIIMMIDLILR